MLLLSVGAPAGADESAATAAAEAWYRRCPLPTGCEALPLTPQYPEETLHVGLSSGRETDRTYVQFDLSDLPSGATLEDGTLAVPVSGPEDGTEAPESAEMQACLAAAPIDEARGSYAAPPEADCNISSAARFSDGSFRIDLAPFVQSWQNQSRVALAIVPSGAAESGASWHIAMSSARRSGGSPMRATFGYEVPASLPSRGLSERPAAGPSLLIEDGDDSTDVTLPLAAAPTPGLPEPAAAPVPASESAGSQQPPAPASTTTGFAYPAVWLLPLTLLVVGGLLGRSLTRPIVAN